MATNKRHPRFCDFIFDNSKEALAIINSNGEIVRHNKVFGVDHRITLEYSNNLCDFIANYKQPTIEAVKFVSSENIYIMHKILLHEASNDDYYLLKAEKKKGGYWQMIAFSTLVTLVLLIFTINLTTRQQSLQNLQKLNTIQEQLRDAELQF